MSAARRRFRLSRIDGGLPWEVGVPIITIMVISIAGSLWFNWKIDKDLGELSGGRRAFGIEAEIKRELMARRDNLLSKENIIRKAAVFGLFPPTDKQIRKIKKL